MADDRIRFLDLKKRNDAEHERINRRVEELKGLLKETHLELPRILERRAHEAAEPVASESGSEENPGGRGPVGLASMSVATPAQREYYALQLRARKQVVDRVFTAVSLDVAGDGSIVQKLADDGVAPDDLYLKVKVRVALNAVTGGDDTGRTSSIDIDLPSLEDDATVEIVQENLQAMQAIYFSAMLEELRLFQVAD